jgi:P27 family predicted phage terminase small subunit
MMRGRKKIPAKVVQLHGNPSKRPINLNEPQLDSGIPDESLFFLNEMAKRHWDAVASELEAKGILAKLDGGILAAYCTACARLYYAEKTIADEGEYQRDVETGMKKKHPACMLARESRDQIRSIGSELGLTAASRARLKTTPKDSKPQGAKKFLM